MPEKTLSEMVEEISRDFEKTIGINGCAYRNTSKISFFDAHAAQLVTYAKSLLEIQTRMKNAGIIPPK